MRVEWTILSSLAHWHSRYTSSINSADTVQAVTCNNALFHAAEDFFRIAPALAGIKKIELQSIFNIRSCPVVLNLKKGDTQKTDWDVFFQIVFIMHTLARTLRHGERLRHQDGCSMDHSLLPHTGTQDKHPLVILQTHQKNRLRWFFFAGCFFHARSGKLSLRHGERLRHWDGCSMDHSLLPHTGTQDKHLLVILHTHQKNRLSLFFSCTLRQVNLKAWWEAGSY